MPELNNLYVDTHFHIDKYKDHKELYKYINYNKIFTICVTNSIEEYVSCKDSYKETKYVKFALGYNPNVIYKDKFDMDLFRKNISNVKIIGEIGLDFSNKSMANKLYQMEVLEKIFGYTYNKNKIYSIHCYKAHDELYEILKSYKIEKFIMHWFNGTKEDLVKFIKLGAYFSINVSMLKNKELKDIIQNIPKNKLLFESDGPYTKFKSQKYKPNDIYDIYEYISKEMKIENFIELININIKELFK